MCDVSFLFDHCSVFLIAEEGARVVGAWPRLAQVVVEGVLRANKARHLPQKDLRR